MKPINIFIGLFSAFIIMSIGVCLRPLGELLVIVVCSIGIGVFIVFFVFMWCKLDELDKLEQEKKENERYTKVMSDL